MNLKPTKDRVAIRPDEMESVTKAGIVIPETAKHKPKSGMVVAIGPDAEGVKVGDRVLHSEFAGFTIADDEGDLLVMTTDEILAVYD